MSKQQKEAAPKSNMPRRQTALSHGQGGPEAKAGLLLKAQLWGVEEERGILVLVSPLSLFRSFITIARAWQVHCC
jgi:hypothetical protein